MKNYYVYILTNRSNNVLYIGVTNNIERRIAEHKSHLIKGFTAKYNVDKCVFVEMFSNIKDALACEKKLKHLKREDKFKLINEKNPDFKDLSF